MSTPPTSAAILVVDDQPAVNRYVCRLLTRTGYSVHSACSVTDAQDFLGDHRVDAIVSDIYMPDGTGIDLLRFVRDRDEDVPVLLMTGDPRQDTAVTAVELGASDYLFKPLDVQVLTAKVAAAIHRYRKLLAERRAYERSVRTAPHSEAELREVLHTTMSTAWLAFQPVVIPDGRTFGYEALLRSPDLPPVSILELAGRIGAVADVAHVVHSLLADRLDDLPDGEVVFINAHPSDISSGLFLAQRAPIRSHASRLVIEITERASIGKVPALKRHIQELREAGYRFAIDDLGAGYASLNSVANLRPDFVKLDDGLVRDLDGNPMKRRLVASVIEVCHDTGMFVVAEGVESESEERCLVDLGCDLLQGFRVGRPAREICVT